MGHSVGVVRGLGSGRVRSAWGSPNKILAWLVDTKYAYRDVML